MPGGHVVAGSNPAIPTNSVISVNIKLNGYPGLAAEVLVVVITKSIFESGHLVVACFSGVVSMPEIEEYLFWLVKNRDETIKADFSQLIYTEKLERIDIQLKDIHRISHLNATVGRARGGFNSALVVPDLKYYWMAKLHKTLSKSSNINTRIFRNIDEAFVWLKFENQLNC
jgi:hypothetical protein